MQILTRPTTPEPPADAKECAKWYGRRNGVRTALLKGTKAADDSCRYLSVALPLYRRGFVVWNISKKSDKAGDKAGASGWNSLAYEATENLHRFIAGKHPTANVCVISHRGVGNPIVLDIDADGVIEKIERETGHKLPATYTVATRPRTAPFKRHYYFLQTELSVASFDVEMNGIFRDLTRTEEKDGKQVHPNMLDVKGCGGGGFVVAAGSVRAPDAKCPEGDVYTCVDDSDIATIPEWLVTWLKDTRAAIEQVCREAQEKRDMVMRLTT
jgi:Bifunctional DNA primase/polymerase, N-terminal